MSGAEQAEQRLPSPPPSSSGDFQAGLSQLIQHNDVTRQKPSPYNYDSDYLHSGQNTTYGSPASTHWLVDQHGMESYQDSWSKGDNVHLDIRQVSCQNIEKSVRLNRLIPTRSGMTTHYSYRISKEVTSQRHPEKIQ